MKLAKLLFVMSFCLLLAGCNNEFAKQEYHSDEKISQESERYAKTGSTFSQTSDGISFTADKFDGREKLWSHLLKEDQELEVTITFSLSAGQAKLVHIDPDGTISTIIECTPETEANDPVAKTISFKKGKNRLKIVGYDCEDIDLKMTFMNPY